MNLISYAQNHEDIMLWRALGHVNNGFYVDVGANDPTADSVTKLFYDRGWRGINVEPSAECFAHLQEQRPRDINLACAVGDHNGSITFYDAETRGWSTTDQEVGDRYLASAQATTRQVELLTLDAILERNPAGQIHFIKIDVEGAEAAVLRGLDLARFRPWILVIESLDPVSHEIRFADWEPRLLGNGYRLAYFDGLNRYYLAPEHSDLAPAFATPANVLDGFQTNAQVSLQQRYAEIEALLAEAQIRHQRHSYDLQMRIHEIEDASRTHLAAAHQNYDAIVSSSSWRITRPLRELNGTFRRVKLRGKSTLRAGFVTSKSQLRKLLAGTARRLDHFPGLKRTAIRIIRKYPAIDSRLRSSLAAQRLIGTEVQQVVAIADLVDATREVERNCADFAALPHPAGQRVLYLYVDHTSHCTTNTGVQRVARALATSLVSRGECVRYVKWDANSGQCLLLNASERKHLARWNGPALGDGDSEIYPAASQPQIPVAARAVGENHWLIVPEVTHITFQRQPVTLDLLLWSRRMGLKSGFVFYDAIPLRREELRAASEKHACYMQQLMLADVVWPISEWSSKDLLSYWVDHEHADKTTLAEIQTIPLSGESSRRKRVTTAIQATETLILSVGTIDARKNQVQLIHAFESFRRKHPGSAWRLTLAGNLDPLVASEVERAMRADPAITHLGHVTDQALDDLYQSCAFTVFPSVEEGFGLPILESLWYGKPCVCANFGSMAEVAREGGCLMLDTRDAGALESAISRLIQDDTLRSALAAEALSRPIRTWDEYAEVICARIDREGSAATHLGLIYYWIDATLQFSKNTGIQRVSRQLARSLMETGMDLIPVKWDEKLRQFGPVSHEELEFFAQWNGPDASIWHDWVVPASSPRNSWLFMPDLPLNRSADDRQRLIRFARDAGLHCAAIFYDAIPWKMRKIYPPHFAEAHREYMMGLAAYDLVLPISAFSRDDLVEFLGTELPRPQSLEYEIKAVSLPGEFAESPRVTEVRPNSGGPINILCVGTVEPRKNHEALLKAFELVTQRTAGELQLVIAGGSHSIEPALADRVRAFISDHPTVVWEEHADDTRLRELHMACDFTVYPSVEEGFGLPILESLWYSKPCVCANFGAMLEVAEGGGCLTADVRNIDDLAAALEQMISDSTLRANLSQEAAARSFKSWQDYAKEVGIRLAQVTPKPLEQEAMLPPEEVAARALAMHLTVRPKLSVCISTFNRAEWLAVGLKNWSRQYPEPLPGVEFLVCDNTSTDHTPDVVKPYLNRPDFAYHRNDRNVGMLGNLRETARYARGEYVWIMGDDDLLLPGSIERILAAIHQHPNVALVYLNYAFTRIEDARTVKDFETFFREATPIVPAEADRAGPIRTICTSNENFFTAIYTLVFRRDHAMKAYSQDTSGRPFSTMLTCIPTTHYVLNHMMEEHGAWLGSPQLVVNMNVSWMKYAPLWILERIPQMYELAERKGVTKEEMDHWRRFTLDAVPHYFKEIFENDPLNNAAYLSVSRLVRRFKHFPEFKEVQPGLEAIYGKAHAAGHPAAKLPASRVFPKAASQ
jgi:FkbM family methyltransferase